VLRGDCDNASRVSVVTRDAVTILKLISVMVLEICSRVPVLSPSLDVRVSYPQAISPSPRGPADSESSLA
jgi:hypothetical protein